MKKILLAVSIVTFSFFLTSCDKTNKVSNTTGNPDTIVVKKDTAIEKIDTASFNK